MERLTARKSARCSRASMITCRDLASAPRGAKSSTRAVRRIRRRNHPDEAEHGVIEVDRVQLGASAPRRERQSLEIEDTPGEESSEPDRPSVSKENGNLVSHHR